MHDTRPLLESYAFPALRRGRLETLQVNLGYRCNQACFHCHVNAGPNRTEEMDDATIAQVIAVLDARAVATLDLTGGAPELHPRFRDLVVAARAMGVHVIDRCNLTILTEPGHDDLAVFLAEHEVEVIASLPCYTADNVDKQRGDGVFDRSITGLRLLNSLGYGAPGGQLLLNLVYNPLGPSLPPDQHQLEADYKRMLALHHGVRFNHLFALANMPINRFGATLVTKKQFAGYMDVLTAAHRDDNLDGVMCRTLVSVDWRGQLYDCDFNQMLELPFGAMESAPDRRAHLRDLLERPVDGAPIRVSGHCFGCTAGQGSSCGGALAAE